MVPGSRAVETAVKKNERYWSRGIPQITKLIAPSAKATYATARRGPKRSPATANGIDAIPTRYTDMSTIVAEYTSCPALLNAKAPQIVSGSIIEIAKAVLLR